MYQHVSEVEQHPPRGIQPLDAERPYTYPTQVLDHALRDSPDLAPVRGAADDEAVAIGRLSGELQVDDVFRLAGVCGAREREREFTALDDATSGVQTDTAWNEVSTT